MVVANIEGVEKIGEQVWQRDGFFGKINPDYSTHKNDFPENCLCYINQAYLTVKDRDTMIYCDYIILRQIVVFRSPPDSEGDNIDKLIKNDKKLVKIYMPMYDLTTGKFLGVKESVGYIMIRNQEDEVFLSYGFFQGIQLASIAIKSSLYQIYLEAMRLILINLQIIWRVKQRCLTYVFICLQSPIEKKKLTGIRTWYPLYRLLLRSVI